jgi:hypothetical protein
MRQTVADFQIGLGRMQDFTQNAVVACDELRAAV